MRYLGLLELVEEIRKKTSRAKHCTIEESGVVALLSEFADEMELFDKRLSELETRVTEKVDAVSTFILPSKL